MTSKAKPKKRRAPRRKITSPPKITQQQIDEAIANARKAVFAPLPSLPPQTSVAAPPPTPRTHVYRNVTKLPWWLRLANSRAPDERIGPDYLHRWHVIPRNRFFNIYLHYFQHSDDDRALHDHPWWNFSYLLSGQYVEHTIAAGGVNHRKLYKAGDWKFRRAKSAHRVELLDGQGCWTLFITGPRIRQWGFHCVRGWVHWKKFTDPTDTGRVGAGCGEYGDHR